MYYKFKTVLCIRYELTTSLDKEIIAILGDFVKLKISKGNRPEEFANRPTVIKDSRPFILNNKSNFSTAYQFVEVEFDVSNLNEKELLEYVNEYVQSNFKTRYADSEELFDKISNTTILNIDIIEKTVKEES